jgi:hypothetical protein
MASRGLNAAQTYAPTHGGRVESLAVVFRYQLHLVAVANQLHQHFAGLGVFEHVVKQLLHQSIHHYFGALRQALVFQPIGLALHLQLLAVPQRLTDVAQGGEEAKLEQGLGHHVAGHPPQLADGAIEVLQRTGKQLRTRLGQHHVPAHRAQVQLHRREHAPSPSCRSRASRLRSSCPRSMASVANSCRSCSSS